MNQTYATAAKRIISKYKRAGYDKLEKDDLNRELEMLSTEQELHRIDEGMVDGSEFSNGGMAYMIPKGLTSSQPMPDPTRLVGLGTQQSIANLPQQGNLSPYSTSLIPSMISGVTSLAGNAFLANRAMKNVPQISLPRLSAERISLENERDEARRYARNTGNVARRNIGNTARTRGEYLSNVGAAEAAISRPLMDSLGRSYQQEAIANTQERSRIADRNAQMMSQERQFNAASRAQAQQAKDAYLSAAMQSIPAFARDISAIRQQDAMINSLGDDYGIFMEDYDGRKWYKPKRIVRKYRKK